MCEGSNLCFLSLFDHARDADWLVCVCSPVSLAISSLSLLQWRFSLQITRKVEMGLSQQPQLRVENSSQLITVTRSSQGCIFKKKKSHCSLSLFIFWWPILARLTVEAQMQYCDKEPVSKNTWNEKKKKKSHHILSLRGWFDLYPFPGF